ncbi:MAG: hypothetical protein Q8M84_06970, partial [Thiobacillus sp.]|nr:hypothetical protein [Thiobacillus sp.]
MLNKSLFISAMTSSLLLAFNPAFSADAPMKNQAQEQVYGSQLMTQQERTEYQAKMRNAKTSEEREQIRAQHHKEMQVRARQQGVTLPDEPPARGMGGGMGPG